MASLQGLKCFEFPEHQTHPYSNVSAKIKNHTYYIAKYKGLSDHAPNHFFGETLQRKFMCTL
jgi:hypothetical protein